MKFRERGFTLIEILVAVAIASMALVGMFMATMAYFNIWQTVSSKEQSKRFNRETVTRKLLTNEISSVITELNDAKANDSISFRHLNGTSIREGEEAGKVCLYWQSKNKLSFLQEDKGGITECWLKYMGSKTNDSSPGSTAELRLYYRSLAPNERANFSGNKGDAATFVVLLTECTGINFGYTKVLNSSPDIEFFSTPKFRKSGIGQPDLPEVIQILLPKD